MFKLFECWFKSVIKIFLLIAFLSTAHLNAQKIEADKSLNESYKELPVDSALSWMKKNVYTNTKTYLSFGLETLQRAHETGQNKAIGDVHNEIANWHGYHGLYPNDSVLYHSERALSYYLKGNDTIKIANAYRTLSIDYLNANQLEKAHKALFNALALFEKLRDEVGIATSYRSLADLSINMENFEDAVKYGEMALPLFRNNEEHSPLAVAYLTLIHAYREVGDYPKALMAADSCFYIVKHRAPEQVYVPIRALSARGETYVEIEEYQKAYVDFLESYRLCVSLVGEERCATWRTPIGNVLRLQEKYYEALPHLVAGNDAYEASENELYWTELVKLSQVYQAVGQYENALLSYRKAMDLKDQIHKNQIENLESEAVIKYETGKKDEALAAQETLLKQKNKIQSLIIGIAVLLLVLLLALYFFFRKNSKKTQIILAKNKENELLLKEIHHRVKNNLEMVKSLIALQSAQVQDGNAKEALLASQNRVQSMGIIHQKLYQGTHLGSIEMKDYFINLSEGILDSFNAEEKVKIQLVMEKLDLDIDTAVPIGLIVNELLTNALKYAFPERKGKITIKMDKLDKQKLTLEVSDDGVGKKAMPIQKGTGFGTQLVQLLTQQLNGKMKEENGSGTSIYFEFKLDHAA